MAEFISPDLYNKYKEIVLGYTNALQRREGEIPVRRFTDKEIAEKIGLTEGEVREIRCIAERDLHPIERWLEAWDFKQERCGQFIRKHGRAGKGVQDKG